MAESIALTTYSDLEVFCNMEDTHSPSMAQSDGSLIRKELEVIQELASQGNYREFWDVSLRIDELFMTTEALPGKEFDRLWSQYSKICKDVEEKEAARRAVARSNVAKFEREIESLRHGYGVPDAESPTHLKVSLWRILGTGRGNPQDV